MSKAKKDVMIIYVFRNGIATFIISIIAFVYHIMEYYSITVMAAIQRTFFNNVFTILYFLLLWMLNYLLFEIYKILYDSILVSPIKKAILFTLLPVLVTGIVYSFIPTVFQYSGILISGFMIIRTWYRWYKVKQKK